MHFCMTVWTERDSVFNGIVAVFRKRLNMVNF